MTFFVDVYKIFIKYFPQLMKGVGNTMLIALVGTLIGLVIGLVTGIIRTIPLAKNRALRIVQRCINAIISAYVEIFRGTPMMVQAVVIFWGYAFLNGGVTLPLIPAGIFIVSINTGAYMAEIVRGGIMAVDEGQSEAGRSLGFNYVQTMLFIVIPQAFKSVLPALANEFIVLLKESSVAFYIGVADLTQGGLKIRSLTYSDFLPLLAVALIYLVVVVFLSYLVSLLERRLRKSDR